MIHCLEYGKWVKIHRARLIVQLERLEKSKNIVRLTAPGGKNSMSRFGSKEGCVTKHCVE